MKEPLLFLLLLLPVIVQAQAPVVSSSSPVPNAVSAPTNAPVVVTLSQPVGAGANTLRVFGSQGGGRLAGTVATAGNTLTFTHSQDFQPGEQVSVTVPTTVQASTGAVLATPRVFQFTTAVSGGSGTFVAGPTVAVGGTFPKRAVAADIDNDGDLDLVASTFSASLAVRLNNGSGGFSSAPGVSVGNNADVLLAADVDADGDLDLASCNGQTLAVRLNNGSGGFSVGSDVTLGTGPSNLISNMVAGDIDGDGDLDLVLNSATISLLLNNGAGGFSVGPAIGPGGQLLLALGDVDNDGDLDLLSEASTPFGIYALSLRLNAGNGTFGTATQVAVGAAHHSATLADIDNDGDLDLLAAGGTDTSIRFNNGSGMFSGASTVATGTGEQEVSTADLDGDGDLDLFATNYTAGVVNVRLNNGAGIFSGTGSYFVANSLNSATAADIDGDGDLDLLAAASRGNNVGVLLNQNNASFAVTAVAPTRNLRNAPRGSNVAATFSLPINNTPASTAALKVFGSQRGGLLAGTSTAAGNTLTFDPATDFRPGERISVSLSRAARSGSYLLNKPEVYQFTTAVGGGTGTFAGASLLGGLFSFPIAVRAADMDGDGDLDALSLAQYTSGGSSVAIQTNNGNGTFVAGGAAATGDFPSGFEVADMDGDGDLDVVSSYGDGTTANPGRVGVRFNNGSGGFPTSSAVQVGTFASGLTTGDVDGDGDLDVVAINGGALAAVCLNSGNGVLSTSANVTLNSAVYNLVLADIDSDGDLDLLAALGSRVGVHLNNGLGVFGAGTIVSVPAAKALTTADVDGDGDLDLLSCDGLSLGVRFNNSSGQFGGGTTIPVAGNDGTRFSIAAGDIDGDGDLDAVMGGGSLTGVMSVRLNDGTGVFGEGYDPVVAPDLSMPAATALADLDGDGDLDWLVARYNGGGLQVLLNRTTPIITTVAPAAGIIGGTVTITGANLTGATTLTLNGVAITSFTVINATTISFTLPAGSNTGPIVVTTPLGTATSTTYSVVPVPVVASFTPASGAVGTTVALTGTNFTGATTVTVGGVAAVFAAVSATRITLTVPPAAVSGPIAVTAAGGTGTSGTSFTVTVPPTIASFTPITAGSGTLITVTGTNLAGATNVALSGITVGSIAVVNATTITFTLPAGAVSGPISVTTPGGMATSASTFTVVTPPTLSLLIPAAQVAGSGPFSLMLVGTGFTAASTVSFDGATYAQTSSTYNTLNVLIPAAALTAVGLRPVTVTNLAGTSTAFSFLVSRPSTAGAYENFEAAAKYSYPAGNVTLSSGSWDFSEALTGTTLEDKFYGLQAARLQAGSIAMNFDKPNGAGTVVVHAALFGSDTGASFFLEKSIDGGASYSAVAGAPATLTATLTPYSFAVNQPGNVRFRISSTNTTIGAGPRVMIDDLSVTDYLVTSTRTGSVGSALVLFPNPAKEVLTVRHPTTALTGLKAELLDLAGRVVKTVTLPVNGQINVGGLSAGIYLLRVAGLTQRVNLL